MKVLLRVVSTLALFWFAPPSIQEAALVVTAYWGEAWATFAVAVLLAGCGFLFEFFVAGRPGWFMATILPVTVIIRYALSIGLGLSVDVIPVGLPGVGPNPLAEIIVTALSLGLAAHVVNLVRRRLVQRRRTKNSTGDSRWFRGR